MVALPLLVRISLLRPDTPSSVKYPPPVAVYAGEFVVEPEIVPTSELIVVPVPEYVDVLLKSS